MTPARTGIIPARAGFTLTSRALATLFRDHPRSRGVYDHPQTRLLRRDGSSPLARGLLSDGPSDSGERRIIPARAGFTSNPTEDSDKDSDHPRSRGVYPAQQRCCWAGMGSSPLARGLPAQRGIGRRGRGIIPARAGFTPPPLPRSP